MSYYNSKVETEQAKKKKSQADLTQFGGGRRNSGGGEPKEALLLGERRSPPALSFRRHLISTGLLTLSLLLCSFSLSLSPLFSLMWNCEVNGITGLQKIIFDKKNGWSWVIGCENVWSLKLVGWNKIELFPWFFFGYVIVWCGI